MGRRTFKIGEEVAIPNLGRGTWESCPKNCGPQSLIRLLRF